jgi:hypothetical protein
MFAEVDFFLIAWSLLDRGEQAATKQGQRKYTCLQMIQNTGNFTLSTPFFLVYYKYYTHF